MVAGRSKQTGEISSGAIPLMLAATLLASVFAASAGSSFLRTLGGGAEGLGTGTVAAACGAARAPDRRAAPVPADEPNMAKGRIPERLPAPSGAVEKAGEGRLLLPVSGFGQPELARELQDTLATMGVQTRMQARVVAGPFATEAEAEAMRGRLGALGLDTGRSEAAR